MWRFESVHGFASVGKLYQKMHFAGSNLSTDPKCPKCIYKISKNFRVEKSGEISRNLRFSCALALFSCLHLNQTLIMAGIVGLEPTKCKSQSLVPSPPWLYPIINFFEKSLESVHFQGFLCQRWAIVPARLQASIVATAELNFRVRNGNGWTLCVKITDWCTFRDSNPGPTD